MSWQDTKELMEWAEKEIQKAVVIPQELMMTAGNRSTADEMELRLREFYRVQSGMDFSAMQRIIAMAVTQPPSEPSQA